MEGPGVLAKTAEAVEGGGAHRSRVYLATDITARQWRGTHDVHLPAPRLDGEDRDSAH